VPARIYRPGFDQSRFDNAQIGGDHYRQIAERELIPRIIERQRQALNVVPDIFQFYQRAYTGRRCSCFASIETSPAASCMVCFGTGNTGGYQLYGHTTEVFDATAESSAIAVVQDFDSITRPIQFRLANNAVKGYIDFTMPVKGGINVCTLASLHAVAPRGTRVRSAVKLFTEPDFTPLSMEAVTERLQQGQTTGGLHFRVVLERDSISATSPKFAFLRIRYQTLQDDKVRGDIPRSTEANRSSEFGWFEDVATRSMYLDASLRSVTTEDLFRQVNTGRLWKCFSVNPNAPGGLLTSWDLEIRLIQNSEKYASIP
jgi:hypothetical protein